MLVPTSAAPRRRPRARAVAPFAAVAIAVAGLTTAPASATGVDPELPPQEPGVTLRTYQLAQDPGAVCELREAQTPNVDKVMSTIDWTTAEQFGAEDQFISHVLGNLHVEVEGEYQFRVTNDDGAIVHLGDQEILNNDGPNDSTSVEATTTLTVGTHPLLVEYFEGADKQRLTLEWMPPGAETFQVIPESALSTETDVVRVTAPGYKFCVGSTDSPGDGLRLDAVNPGYDLTSLRPEGFEPRVSGLAFNDDDQLAVLTAGEVSSGGWEEDPRTGELYLLDNVVGETSPEQVSPTLIAEDLFNPMGVQAMGEDFVVSERDQLTQLSDPDGDGYYDTRTALATWPDGGNFHEFAFGLVSDEDHYYVNLSVAIDPGGATTNPQPAEGRGTTISIDRESGEVSYVAGGLRTPNGIGWGPNGDLFAMDNQGAWLPSSKLVHVEQDRFFNHYTNPAGPFDSEPVTQPAVWIPQNEIGNSPSAPIMLSEGVFAGQMLFGDVTYGGLQRAFLEEVDGEYQGAVFRHTAGLEAGVNRVIEGPDGALYVGGIGEGGNWGEAGKLSHGLQKLTPVNEDTFDVKEMRVVEGGFEVEYTHPVSADVAADLTGSYEVRQWGYVPTQQYGGPKIGEQTLGVTDAQLSEDGTTVTLQIDGLQPGNVVHLRSPRPFASQAGAELLSTEAWYTLNALPGYEAPKDRGWYEAELAQPLGNSSIALDHSNYSGSGFAAGMNSTGTGRTFTVTVDEAGTYPVNLRYANGIHPFPELQDKSVSLYVNDQEQDTWMLPTTGDWKTWQVATRDLALQEGANTITIRQDEGDDGNVNLDVLSVGSQFDICTPAGIEDGYTGLFDGTLASLDDWRMAGPGGFGRQDDCSIRTEGGMGLLWYTEQEFDDYSLKLDWKLVKDDNAGVFVGFPNPGDDPWVAVNEGYEIQIDATDEDDRTTGAIYTFQGADLEARDAALNPVGQWNAYEIRVEGDRIRIYLNEVLVNDFTSTDPARDLSSGFIGLQNHGGGETVSFRNVRIMDLAAPEQFSMEVSAQARCLGTRGYLAVSATNTDETAADVTIETPFGSRTFEDVAPGQMAFHMFSTRQASVAAGAADVSASGSDGSTGEYDAEYDAASCG